MQGTTYRQSKPLLKLTQDLVKNLLDTDLVSETAKEWIRDTGTVHVANALFRANHPPQGLSPLLDRACSQIEAFAKEFANRDPYNRSEDILEFCLTGPGSSPWVIGREVRGMPRLADQNRGPNKWPHWHDGAAWATRTTMTRSRFKAMSP